MPKRRKFLSILDQIYQIPYTFLIIIHANALKRISRSYLWLFISFRNIVIKMTRGHIKTYKFSCIASITLRLLRWFTALIPPQPGQRNPVKVRTGQTISCFDIIIYDHALSMAYALPYITAFLTIAIIVILHVKSSVTEIIICARGFKHFYKRFRFGFDHSLGNFIYSVHYDLYG